MICHQRRSAAYNLMCMRSSLKKTLAVGSTVLMALVIGFLSFRGGVEADAGTRVVTRKSAPQGKTAKKARFAKHQRISEEKISSSRIAAAKAAAAREEEEDEELSLTKLQRAIMAELQQALDDENLAGVRKAIAKFPRSLDAAKGEVEVPRYMREQAIEALKWFGAKAAEDMLDFALDSDDSLADEGWDGFVEALSDPDMSDFARAELVKASLKTLTDADKVEEMLDQLFQMRNSVKADTILDILQNGTKPAQEKLIEDLGAHLDGEEISTMDDVQRWKLQNPDEPEDGEIYGGAQANGSEQ